MLIFEERKMNLTSSQLNTLRGKIAALGDVVLIHRISTQETFQLSHGEVEEISVALGLLAKARE
jgi:hypothetical protein